MTAILVTGTGRSGTSMMGGVLDALGVWMGDELIRPDANNRLGYFEDARVVGLVKQLLNDRQTPMEVVKECAGHLRDRAEEAARRQVPWGVKHPGFCSPCRGVAVLDLLYPYWPQPPRIVVMRRKMLDVTQSYRRAYGHDGSALMRQREELAGRIAEKYGALVLDYDDVLARPRDYVIQVGDWCRLWPTSEQLDEAVGRVRPEERRCGRGGSDETGVVPETDGAPMPVRARGGAR